MAPNQSGTEPNDVTDSSTPIVRSQLKIPVISNVELHPFSLFKPLQFRKQRDYPNADPYDTKPGEKPYKLEIVWLNVLIFAYLHFATVCATYMPIRSSEAWFGTDVKCINE